MEDKVNKQMRWGLGIGLVLGVLIVLIILIAQANDKSGDKSGDKSDNTSDTSDTKEPYFYPANPASVDDTAYYNTLMMSEVSEGVANGVKGPNGTVAGGPISDNGNKNRQDSEMEIADSNARGRFDFRPLPDDDIYTNMNIPLYPAVPACAQNDGYLGDFHYYDPEPQNDLRWDETKLDAGNIQPAFLYPHRPYGPRMGL